MSEQNAKQMANRRRFLATVAGTTIAIAGCSGEDTDDSSGEDEPDSSTDNSPDSSTEESPDPDGSRNTGAVTGIERAYTIPNVTPIGIDGDRVITRTSVDDGLAFAAFNYLTGERLWIRSLDSYETPAISVGGRIGHGRLYTIGSESDEDNYINVIDLTTGDLLGTQEFEGDDPTRLVPLNGGAFFITGVVRDHTAFYVNGDSAEREPSFAPSDVWDLDQETATAPANLHALAGDGMYAVGRNLTQALGGVEFRYGDTEPRQNVAVTGRINTYGIPRPSSENAVFGSRVDGFSDDPPAQARSREDGSLLWERSDNYYIPPYGYGGDTLAYLGADEGERVIGVEPSNGDIRWERTDLDLPTTPGNSVNAPYAVTERALVVGTSSGVKLFSLADGTTVARSEDASFASFLATQSRVLTTGSVTTEEGEADGMVVYEY